MCKNELNGSTVIRVRNIFIFCILESAENKTVCEGWSSDEGKYVKYCLQDSDVVYYGRSLRTFRRDFDKFLHDITFQKKVNFRTLSYFNKDIF